MWSKYYYSSAKNIRGSLATCSIKTCVGDIDIDIK